MPNMVAVQEEVQEEVTTVWQQLPESVLLYVFSCLPCRPLLNASQVCKMWHRIAMDDFLWKDLFYRVWKIDSDIPMAPGKSLWMNEFRRLYYHTPKLESEVLREHRDQVLHVSFSHNGEMFATSSKDGFVKVWRASYPATVKYYADMKEFTWKYTQFSQFNENDTHLLVSGVHFGTNSTSGEIAVFSLIGGFQLQCRVLNKPYDIFGTWYNNSYLLSGNLHWLGHLTSCSVLWLNRASQALESEHKSVVLGLYKFRNINASSIRTIMIARCNDGQAKPISMHENTPKWHAMTIDGKDTSHFECRQGKARRRNPTTQMSSQKMQIYSDNANHMLLLEVDNDSEDFNETIEYNENYRRAENTFTDSASGQNPLEGTSSSHVNALDDDDFSPIGEYEPDSLPENRGRENYQLPQYQSDYSSHQWLPTDHHQSGQCSSEPMDSSESACGMSSTSDNRNYQMPFSADGDKYLIFTTGMKTYTPHQIGIKRIHECDAADKMKVMVAGMKAKRNLMAQGGDAFAVDPGVQPEPVLHEHVDHGADQFDTVDHLIELHGHIIGMCLSPDHRYLYVNSRPWPQGYDIDDPLNPPPIAQEIDIHVIDLQSMQEVGTMHRAHKAYTSNDECFFIFLDVCDEYVASGAEDKHGYLWDRHYGVCVTTFPHVDVVNSVAFNPKDPEMLITASDDHTLKIWRSRSLESRVKGTRTVIV